MLMPEFLSIIAWVVAFIFAVAVIAFLSDTLFKAVEKDKSKRIYPDVADAIANDAPIHPNILKPEVAHLENKLGAEAYFYLKQKGEIDNLIPDFSNYKPKAYIWRS